MIVARLTARWSMIRWIADWVRLGRSTTGCGEGGVKPAAGCCWSDGVAGVSGSVGGVGCTGTGCGAAGAGAAACAGAAPSARSTVSPIWISSPLCRSVDWMRRPFTKVPLLEPRSYSVARPSGSTRSAAWRREALPSASTRSTPASRPIVNSVPSTWTVLPAPAPDLMVSCMTPDPNPPGGGSASPSAHHGKRPRGPRQRTPAQVFAAELRPQLELPLLARLDPRRNRREAPHRHRAEQVDLEPPGHGVDAFRVHEKSHRLVERGGDHAAVRVAGRALVVLLDEEPPADAVTRRLELQLQSEEVRDPAAEAELVMGDRH